MKYRYLLAIITLVLITACNPDEDTFYRESNDLRVKFVPVKPYNERLVPLPDGSVVVNCKASDRWDYFLAVIHPDGAVDSLDYCLLSNDPTGANEVEGSVKTNNQGDIFIDNSQYRDANKYRLLKYDKNLNKKFDISGELGKPDYYLVGNVALNNGEFVFLTKYVSWDDYSESYSMFIVSADGVVGDEIPLTFLSSGHNVSDICSIGDEILITYSFKYSSYHMCILNPHNVSECQTVSLERDFIVRLYDSQGRILGYSSGMSNTGFSFFVGSVKRDGSMLLSKPILALSLYCLHDAGDDVLAVGYRVNYSSDGTLETQYIGFIYNIDINTGAIKDSVIMDYNVKPLFLASDGKGGYNLFLERMFKYVNNANQYNPTLDNIYLYNVSDLHELQFSEK